MSIYSRNIVPVCEASKAVKAKISAEEEEFVIRGLFRCGFPLVDLANTKLTEGDIIKGLDMLWLGHPSKSIFKLVAFGTELWACDFRVSFETVTVPTTKNGENGTIILAPKCVICKKAVDTKQAPGDHIYKQQCLVRWIDHKIKEDQTNGY